MLRRSHRKSRIGCVQCKRRHVKCDETRPRCRLCTTSERHCSFSTETQSHTPSSTEASTPNSSDSPAAPAAVSTGQQGDFDKNYNNSLSDAASMLAAWSVCSNTSQQPDGSPDDVLYDAPINTHHIELLSHLLLDPTLFNLGVIKQSPQAHTHATATAISACLSPSTPYALPQLLAYSAFHLSHLHNHHHSNPYKNLSITLQTRALTLFTSPSSQITTPTPQTSIPILLFSTVLAHHVLADTLSKRHDSSHSTLPAFLKTYTQALKVHRGIHTIASPAWPLLLHAASPSLSPILSLSAAFGARAPKGAHTAQLHRLISTATESLSGSEREACRVAARYLQVGFDAHDEDDGEEEGMDENEKEKKGRHHMLFLWGMHVGPEFTALLDARRKEAVVVLAYYAVLLHYGRELWQVGDTGVYLMGLIEDFLGDEWSYWLELPRRMIVEAM